MDPDMINSPKWFPDALRVGLLAPVVLEAAGLLVKPKPVALVLSLKY